MPFRTRSAIRTLVIEWTGTPTTDDVRKVSTEVQAFAREQSGSKVALWIVIPIERVDLPSPEVRTAFQEVMPTIFARCESSDVIVVGTGVRATLMRTAIRTMAVLARTSAGTRVYDSVDAAVRERSLPADVAAMLRAG